MSKTLREWKGTKIVINRVDHGVGTVYYWSTDHYGTGGARSIDAAYARAVNAIEGYMAPAWVEPYL